MCSKVDSVGFHDPCKSLGDVADLMTDRFAPGSAALPVWFVYEVVRPLSSRNPFSVFQYPTIRKNPLFPALGTGEASCRRPREAWITGRIHGANKGLNQSNELIARRLQLLPFCARLLAVLSFLFRTPIQRGTKQVI